MDSATRRLAIDPFCGELIRQIRTTTWNASATGLKGPMDYLDGLRYLCWMVEPGMKRRPAPRSHQPIGAMTAELPPWLFGKEKGRPARRARTGSLAQQLLERKVGPRR